MAESRTTYHAITCTDTTCDPTCTAPVYDKWGVTVFHGVNTTVMRRMPAESADSIVTDPPSGTRFMNRAWDSDMGGRNRWVEQMSEQMAGAYRLLKPGGHGLVWALPRTSHWTAWALEDAGFEVRDCITHLFGGGMPKGKHHLKPMSEHWWLIRKPPGMSVTTCIAEHGTGGLGIDACRVAAASGDYDHPGNDNRAHTETAYGYHEAEGRQAKPHGAGRWPPNALASHTGDCVQIGTREVRTGTAVQRNCSGAKPASVYGTYGTTTNDQTYGGVDGREEMPAYDCAPGCPVAELDEQSGSLSAGGTIRGTARSGGIMGASTVQMREKFEGYADPGGASRFLPVFGWHEKAPTAERPRVNGKSHNTVKAVDLTRWLVRLVTPPGGLVLDLYAGSGTTGQAARAEGMRAVLIEQDPESIGFIKARLDARPRTEAPAEPGTTPAPADDHVHDLLDLLDGAG